MHESSPQPSSQQSADDSNRSVLIVSNRLPMTFHRADRGVEGRRSAGGLVSALEPVLRDRGGKWIGWAGIELPEGDHFDSDDPYTMQPVRISDAEVEGYYHGFSNRTLWPLFHCFNERAKFHKSDWEAYEKVNIRFAEVTAAAAPEGGLVWIHDYHLMLMPIYLRQSRPDLRIAFFLHIPFPPWDVFRLLPWHREILRRILGADLIGFHVDPYTDNFLDCVEHCLPARVDRQNRLIEHGGRTTRVGSYPIGIDFDFFANFSQSAPDFLRGSERVILGVDRLDYTKGIPQKLRAFERLLELHPEHRGQVVLLQLAVPSRSQVSEYQTLKKNIDEIVGRIGGRFATADWSPIRYLYQSIDQEQLTALYRDSDVALITPGRDGMNLVAKEYVACQVREPGVLVLSSMTGAAETMREAISVNPNDLDGTAESIHRALTMDWEERRSRMTSLRRRERRDNVNAWVDSFVNDASAGPSELQPLTQGEFSSWLNPFLKTYRVALFLGYDGALVPVTELGPQGNPSDELRDALELCARKPSVDVAIVSGRPLAELQTIVGNPELIYAGNRGLEIAGPEVAAFRHQETSTFEERAQHLATELNAIKVDGSWIETKGASLIFRFPKVRPSQRGELRDQIIEIAHTAEFETREVEAGIEARPFTSWDKGNAVLHILRERYGEDWQDFIRVVYVGYDLADEKVFTMLRGLGVTFRVGHADTLTAASHHLPNIESVRALIDWLAQTRE